MILGSSGESAFILSFCTVSEKLGQLATEHPSALVGQLGKTQPLSLSTCFAFARSLSLSHIQSGFIHYQLSSCIVLRTDEGRTFRYSLPGNKFPHTKPVLNVQGSAQAAELLSELDERAHDGQSWRNNFHSFSSTVNQALSEGKTKNLSCKLA